MKKNSLKMFAWAGLSAIFLYACSNPNADGRTSEKIEEEAMAVHDEIMPQIGAFDRQTNRIDSILLNLDSLKQLQPELDTAQVRTDLLALKGRLEGATDAMMTWMKDFETDPKLDSEEAKKAYFESELDKVTKMKKTFEEVAKEGTEKLARF